jgi:hypothetical protein
MQCIYFIFFQDQQEQAEKQKDKRKDLEKDSSFCYTDDVLSLNNS